ncbi:hypothetical protein, partial [Marinobacter sp.]|uniref:hypothetical protein n=1 Tax=Marinobacter sp. TaxID=50741 RepID=UPI003297AF9C
GGWRSRQRHPADTGGGGKWCRQHGHCHHEERNQPRTQDARAYIAQDVHRPLLYDECGNTHYQQHQYEYGGTGGSWGNRGEGPYTPDPAMVSNANIATAAVGAQQQQQQRLPPPQFQHQPHQPHQQEMARYTSIPAPPSAAYSSPGSDPAPCRLHAFVMHFVPVG